MNLIYKLTLFIKLYTHIKKGAIVCNFKGIKKRNSVIIFLYIQLKIGTMMISGNESLSIALLPIILIVLTATIGIYIWKSIKNR